MRLAITIGALVAIAIIATFVMTVRERRRHEKLAQTRRPLTRADFIGELVLAGVPGDVAEFVWNEFQPYYFSPLTPYPTDRPIGEIKIDGDDLSDIVQKFEKDFQRPWRGQWIGPNDPTLAEFGRALMDSTSKS